MDTSMFAIPFEGSASCGDYQEKDGIKYPSSLKAVWHYDSGDLAYFDGRNIAVEYHVKM